jgi:hypothetical protein
MAGRAASAAAASGCGTRADEGAPASQNSRKASDIRWRSTWKPSPDLGQQRR